MIRCYLSLGSNQNFPERQIRRAIQALKRLPSTAVGKISSLYWNKAWGLQAQQNFCNVMLELTTLLPPFLLLAYCKKIEKTQGRIRKKPWGPRTLDIDIILYANRRIKTKDLVIPHPRMLLRDFVLLPLLEISPPLYHRILGGQ